MNWYYESAGSQQGPVSDADLDRLLAEGKITPDTLIWREGMTSWTALRAARPPAPVPGMAPAPGTAPGGETGGTDIPQPGYIRCTLTGKWFPPSEIFYQDGKPYSAAAKPQVIASLQAGEIVPSASGDRTGPAWEQRATLGIWKAVVETCKAVLLQPTQCFATMKREGGIGGPFAFFMLTAVVGIVVSQLYGMLFQGAMLSAMGGIASQNTSGQPFPMAAMLGGGVMGGIIGIIAALVIVPIWLFIWTGLVHLTLMMLKGANHPFETTFRVVCYTNGAAMALYLVPICGSTVGWIWAIVAMCLGLGKAQDTSTEKGVGATLIPLAVCCVTVIGLYAILIGTVVAAVSASGGLK